MQRFFARITASSASPQTALALHPGLHLGNRLLPNHLARLAIVHETLPLQFFENQYRLHGPAQHRRGQTYVGRVGPRLAIEAALDDVVGVRQSCRLRAFADFSPFGIRCTDPALLPLFALLSRRHQPARTPMEDTLYLPRSNRHNHIVLISLIIFHPTAPNLQSLFLHHSTPECHYHNKPDSSYHV